MSILSEKNEAQSAWRRGVEAAEKDDRITRAKELIDLLPTSLPVLSSALSASADSIRDREFQFTLFCYLDDALDRENTKHLLPEILQLVSDYLAHAADNRALTTWMAVDLLTDHLPPNPAADTYQSLLRTTRYAVARNQLVQGAVKLLERLPQHRREQLLQQIATLAKDRSPLVRKEVSDLLAASDQKTKTGSLKARR